MTEKETARRDIALLVEKYRDSLKVTRANESQMRKDFILPMFRALGWDTENPAEVTAEEHIVRKIADFGFYVNGIPVFYLETKKASENVEKGDMVQAINYAFLKGVTWAILTNFEQFMVFNAELEETEPINARFLDLKHE